MAQTMLLKDHSLLKETSDSRRNAGSWPALQNVPNEDGASRHTDNKDTIGSQGSYQRT